MYTDADIYGEIMGLVERAMLLEGELFTLPWNSLRRRDVALEVCHTLLRSARLARLTQNQIIIPAFAGMIAALEQICPQELEKVKARKEDS